MWLTRAWCGFTTNLSNASYILFAFRATKSKVLAIGTHMWIWWSISLKNWWMLNSVFCWSTTYSKLTRLKDIFFSQECSTWPMVWDFIWVFPPLWITKFQKFVNYWQNCFWWSILHWNLLCIFCSTNLFVLLFFQNVNKNNSNNKNLVHSNNVTKQSSIYSLKKEIMNSLTSLLDNVPN